MEDEELRRLAEEWDPVLGVRGAMSDERDKRLEHARREVAAWITLPRAGAPPPREEARIILRALERAEAENEALRAERDRLSEVGTALMEELCAARDVLAAEAAEMGRLPEQGGYATNMTPAEYRVARAVEDIDSLVKSHGAEMEQARRALASGEEGR